ncbi:unnamed protein product, partial [Dicrocoelium dendriticum]
ASRSRSTQDSIADPLESLGDSSCASSLRSDSDAADEMELRKNSLVHLSVPLTSFGSKSASPPREILQHSALSSTSLIEQQRTSSISRHRLLLRSETALPDQLPPSKVEPLYEDSRPRAQAKRLIKSSSLQDDEVYSVSTAPQQPPPIPPRITVAGSILMHAPDDRKKSRDPDDVNQATAPPVPPKVKPRLRGPLKATPTSSAGTSYLLTSQDCAGVPTNRMRCQSLMNRNSICSLPAALGYETRIVGSLACSPWTGSTVRILDQQNFTSDSVLGTRHNIRDRRHGSVERVSFTSHFNNTNFKQASDSVKLSPLLKTTRTPLAELPRTEVSGVQTRQSKNTTHNSVPTPGDPCGYTVYRVEGRKYLINTPPPTPPRHQQPVQETASESPSIMSVNHQPNAVRRRPYSIDRSTINLAKPIMKALDTVCMFRGATQTPAGLELVQSFEHPEGLDIVGTDRAERRRSCVRRISSHASTISSESNTLISTSTEKVDSIS